MQLFKESAKMVCGCASFKCGFDGWDWLDEKLDKLVKHKDHIKTLENEIEELRDANLSLQQQLSKTEESLETARTYATAEKEKKQRRTFSDASRSAERDLVLLSRVLHISQHNPIAMKGCLMALGVDVEVILEKSKNLSVLPLVPQSQSSRVSVQF